MVLYIIIFVNIIIPDRHDFRQFEKVNAMILLKLPFRQHRKRYKKWQCPNFYYFFSRRPGMTYKSLKYKIVKIAPYKTIWTYTTELETIRFVGEFIWKNPGATQQEMIEIINIIVTAWSK